MATKPFGKIGINHTGNMAKAKIHKSALVDADAKLGADVEIGPFAVIGPKVKIGKGTIIESHVTVKGDTEIGEGNQIGSYTSIGFSAQDKAHRGEDTKTLIGDHNEIREYVSIQRGTLGGKGITTIGSNNQIMSYAHFGHDTLVGNNCMLANCTTLAGHVEFGNNVVTGGLSGYHQFCKVGDFAMVGALTAIYQDVVPYVICTGSRGKLFGINVVGLQRNGYSKEDVDQVNRIYNTFFSSHMVPSQAIEVLRRNEAGDVLDRFVQFVEKSTRGLVTKN